MPKRSSRVVGFATLVIAALVLTSTILTVPARALAPLTIKLATFAPANSAWHKALLDMGDAWTKSTEGRVTLRVYPGGTLGTEASTVKMMSPAVGELQADGLEARMGGPDLGEQLLEVQDVAEEFHSWSRVRRQGGRR